MQIAKWCRWLGAAILVTIMSGPAFGQADTLASIKQKGKIVVGVKADYKPFGFTDPSGKISFGDSNVPQKGVTVIAIKDGKFTLGAELVPAKVPAP